MSNAEYLEKEFGTLRERQRIRLDSVTEYSINRTSSIDRDMIKMILIMLGSILIISQLTTQAQARNITAFIHFNEEAIKQDTHLGDVWWTVDGKNASSSIYDMSDAVYGDSSEPDDDVLTTGYSDELMVAGNTSKICLEEDSEDPDYKSCDYIKADTTEMHFSYPASWQTTVNTP